MKNLLIKEKMTKKQFWYIKKQMLKKCFYSFFVESFHYLNPGKVFYSNWHMQYLSSILEDVGNGKYKNVIICIPPRSLKSTMISVSWCAWLLGNNPALRIMCASYAQKLSTKLSVDCRNLMSSKWYLDIFDKFKFAKDQNTKSKFSSTAGGYRLSSSVASSVIGEGGDILICDDPLSPSQAHSRHYRDKVYNWYMESFSTRLDNKKAGIKIIVMQRLHDDDLCGRIIKKMGDKWKIISIPAIASEKLEFSNNIFKKTMNMGEILNADHEDIEQLEIMREQLGSNAFAAQYLQNPIPESGNVIKQSWLRYYDNCELNDKFIIQSWDIAFTEKGDYSVCSTWQINGNNCYLLDITRFKKEFVELIQAFKDIYEKWKTQCVIIEDTVASKSFIQNIKKNFACNVICSRPKGDKLTRLMLTTPIFESGRVFIPRDALWLSDFLHELLSFPQVKNDDQVDSVSQFLLHFDKMSVDKKRINLL